MKLFWSTRAFEQVNEIIDYLKAERPDRVEEWVEGLFASVERLEQFPQSGRYVPELNRKDV